MDKAAIDEAVDMLAAARRSRQPLPALKESCKPSSIAQAHAVQDALVERLGEPVAGWKVAGLKPGEVMRGAILASRMFASPATIKASDMPLLGVEAEIAFRFDRPLPPRQAAYAMAEVIDSVTALPAIEVVDSRFASYRDTPVLDRLCDLMSNGALVCGEPRQDWRDFDLVQFPVTLRRGEEVLVQSIGGHSNKDPLLPALALANELRSGPGIREGQIVTAGTYTGLEFVAAGDTIVVNFDGFGTVELHFEP